MLIVNFLIMEKKKSLFTLAMAGLLFGACQTDEVSVPTSSGNGAEWTADGKGYVSVAINLPTQPTAVRAANDQFDDGTSEEYYVKDATLILFTAGEGESEAQAKFHSAYKLNAADWNKSGTSEDNITTTTKIVQKINEVKEAKLYALVVLNSNGVVTVNEDNTVTIDQGQSPVTTTTTFENFNLQVSSSVSQNSWTGASFLMSNAPLNTTKGGTYAAEEGTLQTLSLVDMSKICDSEEDAWKNAAATIYVERAQAKVTLTGKSGEFESGSKLPYEVVGWTLDNTNEKSFLVRDYNTAWNNLVSNSTATVANNRRFLGTVPVTDAISLFRTYWGEDVNYSEDAKAELKKVADADGNIGEDVKMADANGEDPLYCFENTADVAHMTEDNNTRVVVKAKLNNGNGFYVVNGNKDVVYVAGNEDNGIDTRIKEAFMDYPGIMAWFKANLQAGQTLEAKNDLEVRMVGPEGGQGGLIREIQVSLTETGKAKMKEGADLTDEQKGCLNGNFEVDLYKDGISYYTVHIAHFGDDLTPWNNGENPLPSVTGDNAGIYPSGTNQDGNYLGRWGVLRNNWYDLNVTNIRTIGSSTVPPVTGEPIDKLDKYISVEINILAWAKRAQDVEL